MNTNTAIKLKKEKVVKIEKKIVELTKEIVVLKEQIELLTKQDSDHRSFLPCFVYLFLDPRKKRKLIFNDRVITHEPFYVGKGKENSHKSHLWYVKNNRHYNEKFQKIVDEISSENLKPIFFIVKNGLTDSEAIEYEKQLIKKIGNGLVNKLKYGKSVWGRKSV